MKSEVRRRSLRRSLQPLQMPPALQLDRPAIRAHDCDALACGLCLLLGAAMVLCAQGLERATEEQRAVSSVWFDVIGHGSNGDDAHCLADATERFGL